MHYNNLITKIQKLNALKQFRHLHLGTCQFSFQYVVFCSYVVVIGGVHIALHIVRTNTSVIYLFFCVYSYLYCTLAQIKFKGKTQNNIRWGSHYPPLAQKSPPHSHNPSLIKIARHWPLGTSRTHLGD